MHCNLWLSMLLLLLGNHRRPPTSGRHCNRQQTALFSAVGTESRFLLYFAVQMSKKQGTAFYYFNNYGNVLWGNEVIKGEHVQWWECLCMQMILHSRGRRERSRGGGSLRVKFASSFSRVQFMLFAVVNTLAVAKVPLLFKLLLNIILNLKLTKV